MIGNEGVNNLQALDTEWKELLGNIAELGLAIAGFISKFLTPLISLLNDAAGGIIAQNRYNALLQDLSPADRAAAEKQFENLTKRVGTGRSGAASQTTSTTDAFKQVFEAFNDKRIITARVPVTDQDRKTFAPPKGKSDGGKSDEDRIRERLELLRIETAAIREQASIKNLISAARIVEDQALENELRLTLEINNIQERLAKTLVRTTDERVKQLEIAKADAQIQAARQAAADKEAERIAQQTRNYETTLANMNAQIELASAMTVEQEKQAKFELEILKFRERNKQLLVDQPELYAKLEASFRKLFELQNQSPLNQYIQQTSKALSDTEGQMVRIVQTVEGQLASGISNFFTGIIDGSKSAEEAFAEMLKGMGQALVQTAAQMIAQYIAIGIARLFAGMGGGDK